LRFFVDHQTLEDGVVLALELEFLVVPLADNGLDLLEEALLQIPASSGGTV